jgi:lysine-ketoglutarate reductase/saccharopine dehydrogenase-like protein (TIGR00300 family)
MTDHHLLSAISPEPSAMSAFTESIALRGHIVDSLILTKVMDAVMDHDGNFEVEEMRIGRHKDETSFAQLKILAKDQTHLDHLLDVVQALGAELVDGGDVHTSPAPHDGVAPSEFYSTTNLPTQVRLHGQWVDVQRIEMDVLVVVNRATGTAQCVPLNELKKGDEVVVGHAGIRVLPLERARARELFSFMGSEVSSEKPKRMMIAQIARELRRIREQRGKILFVAGPAIVHSGAAASLAALIRAGYVTVLFGGNAIATHDIENALYGTSLGVDLKTGQPVEEGHKNHMRAINTTRSIGSIEKAVELGVIRHGIMYECVKNRVPYVLTGSIRDDGPMPGVIMDMSEAQRRMREGVQRTDMALMVATMLHSIATGNLLPAHVKVVAVDINPAVVTKLADRGSFQAIGLVTDAELFLSQLVEELDL